jgi:hypothetical protein
MARSRLIVALLLTYLSFSCVHEATQNVSPAGRFPTPSNSKPRPDYFNQPYGSHERNVLDFWQAESARPTPVVLFFHGGGFVGGDKWTLDPNLLSQCLNAGISVASANYRKSTQAPYPAPMLDGARAVQYLRFRAKDFNIDPNRIAVSGNSAGAGISLWIAFHDNLRQPRARDRVARQSSRVTCACVVGAQSSYDPRFVRSVIGGRAYEHPALPTFYGISLEELDSPKAYALYEDAAAITHVSKDDPPVFMYYTEPQADLAPGPNTGPNLYYPDFGKSLEGHDNPGWGIHHPKFGVALKEVLDPLNIECVLVHRDDFPAGGNAGSEVNRKMVQFMQKQFKMIASD